LQNWGLFKLDAKFEVATAKPEEIKSVIKAKSKDSSNIRFQPEERPWIVVQRPRNRILLFYQRVHKDTVVWKMRPSKGKYKYFVIYIECGNLRKYSI
jgi:hypothetical protein